MTNFVADTLAPFGETVFAEITRLAIQHDAVNLGQGFPNFDGPNFIKDAVTTAMREGHNQYARSAGIPALVEAIASRFERDCGLAVDPMQEVTVTSGCTEAIAAALLGVLNEGNEVILFEPFYDSYRACLALAHAVPRFVTLRPPEFGFTEDDLRAVITPRTRAILVNTPHNPSGRVFTREEMTSIARVCVEHDLVAITDEVYEHLVYDGEHIRLCTLEGMRDRTITLSSLGKTFSLTGWKIGWAIASPHWTEAVRAAHQFLTFATATPLQHGAAAALAAPQTYFDELVAAYRAKRDLLVDGLSDVGFGVSAPAGSYFILADHTPFGFDDDVSFCKHLIEHVGVAAIPPSAFYHDPADGRTLARFAFCKAERTLESAVERMRERLSG